VKRNSALDIYIYQDTGKTPYKFALRNRSVYSGQPNSVVKLDTWWTYNNVWTRLVIVKVQINKTKVSTKNIIEYNPVSSDETFQFSGFTDAGLSNLSIPSSNLTLTFSPEIYKTVYNNLFAILFSIYYDP